MTSVFIGGSRKLTKIANLIEKRLDNIVRNNFTVLIGDANGTDKCVQNYLATKHYPNVIVFCMSGICRNNIGNWETRNIETNSKERDFNFYATKDLRMAEEASYGFMIWDGKSNGTLNNMLNLLERSKKVLVYFSPEKAFFTLHGVGELSTLLAKCGKDDLEKFDKKLSITKFLEKEHSKLEFA